MLKYILVLCSFHMAAETNCSYKGIQMTGDSPVGSTVESRLVNLENGTFV